MEKTGDKKTFKDLCQNSGCNTKLTAKLESNVSNEEKSKRKVNSPSISIFIREDFIPR